MRSKPVFHGGFAKIYNKIYMDKGKRKTPLHAVVSFTCARLVYKPSSVLNGHLSRRYVAVSLKRLVERAGNPYCSVSCIGWGLHRASSPICGWALTSPFHPYPSVRAVFFCCTFLKVAFTGISPAPLPCDARTFLTVLLPRDRPANSQWYNITQASTLQRNKEKSS